MGVKSAKRIIGENSPSDCSLDNDKVARAIFQHRNTPTPELCLSPSQLLLHRQLRDSIPTNPLLYQLHKDWVISAKERKAAFAKRVGTLREQYDKSAHYLKPLEPQTEVLIQNKGKWDSYGRILE